MLYVKRLNGNLLHRQIFIQMKKKNHQLYPWIKSRMCCVYVNVCVFKLYQILPHLKLNCGWTPPYYGRKLNVNAEFGHLTCLWLPDSVCKTSNFRYSCYIYFCTMNMKTSYTCAFIPALQDDRGLYVAGRHLVLTVIFVNNYTRAMHWRVTARAT